MKLSVTLPLTAEFLSVGDLEFWLKVLGLKLTVAVVQENEGEDEGSVGGGELAQVGNV